MSEFDENYGDENVLDPNIRGQLRQAEKDRKARAEAEAQAAAAQRELAFLRAGVPTEGAGEYFMKAYDGPLDADAIRAEAQRINLVQESPGQLGQAPAPQQPEPQFDAEAQARLAELQQMQQMQQVQQGSWNAQGGDPRQELLAKIKATTSPDEVMALMRQAEIEHPDWNIFTGVR